MAGDDTTTGDADTGNAGTGKPHEDGDGDRDRAEDVKGKVEEALGWLTGDRTEEAKGRLRRAEAQSEADAGGEDDDPDTADAVRDATDQVRDEKGELG